MHAMYKKVQIGEAAPSFGTGWLPPLPDLRDYGVDQPDIARMGQRLGLKSTAKAPPSLPSNVDWRKYCSPIENQGGLGSCTAHAAMSVIEYFQRRAFGKHIDGSRLFVYKTSFEDISDFRARDKMLRQRRSLKRSKIRDWTLIRDRSYWSGFQLGLEVLAKCVQNFPAVLSKLISDFLQEADQGKLSIRERSIGLQQVYQPGDKFVRAAAQVNMRQSFL